MFELNYTKHKNNLLFETLEKNEMTKLQNYIPIYEKWFSLNPTNFNNINLNYLAGGTYKRPPFKLGSFQRALGPLIGKIPVSAMLRL